MTVRLEQDSQRSIAGSLRALLGGFFDYAGYVGIRAAFKHGAVDQPCQE